MSIYTPPGPGYRIARTGGTSGAAARDTIAVQRACSTAARRGEAAEGRSSLKTTYLYASLSTLRPAMAMAADGHSSVRRSATAAGCPPPGDTSLLRWRWLDGRRPCGHVRPLSGSMHRHATVR